MLAYVLLGLMATASAAPRSHTHQQLQPDDGESIETYVENKFRALDAESQHYWNAFEKEMKTFAEKMEAFSRRFPNSILQEGVDGDKYVIKISLPGFKEEDISVKSKQGSVVIEAHHKSGNSRSNFFNARSIPNNASGGSWSYDDNVLTVEYDLPTQETESNNED